MRVNLAQVVLRMKEELNVKWPQRMKSPLRDASKWYDFHKDVGYEIRDYRYFKKEMDDLLAKGYLKDLVGNNSEEREHQIGHEAPRSLAHQVVEETPTMSPTSRLSIPYTESLGLIGPLVTRPKVMLKTYTMSRTYTL